MSLPLPDEEAALRVLDRKCSMPDSPNSKRTVKLLAAKPLAYKEAFLQSNTIWGLGNNVRCALEARVSPDTKADEVEGSNPIVVVASQYDATRALQLLLAAGANVEQADR